MHVKYMMMHELTLYERGHRELPLSWNSLEGMGWEEKSEHTVGPARGPLLTALHCIPIYGHALALSAHCCLPLTLRVFVSK